MRRTIILMAAAALVVASCGDDGPTTAAFEIETTPVLMDVTDGGEFTASGDYADLEIEGIRQFGVMTAGNPDDGFYDVFTGTMTFD